MRTGIKGKGQLKRVSILHFATSEDGANIVEEDGTNIVKEEDQIFLFIMRQRL